MDLDGTDLVISFCAAGALRGGVTQTLGQISISMWAAVSGLTELCKGVWNPGVLKSPKSSTQRGAEKAHKTLAHKTLSGTGQRYLCSLGSVDSTYLPLRNYYAINSLIIISRNDYARFAQSSQKEFFRNRLAQWQNGHCANRFLEACYRNSKRADSNKIIAQLPKKNSPRVFLRNRLRRFRAIPWKIIPQ